MDGIGFKEVKAKEIDGVYAAAIEQFGCQKEDILAAWPSVAEGEHLKRRGDGQAPIYLMEQRQIT